METQPEPKLSDTLDPIAQQTANALRGYIADAYMAGYRAGAEAALAALKKASE